MEYEAVASQSYCGRLEVMAFGANKIMDETFLLKLYFGRLMITDIYDDDDDHDDYSCVVASER